MTRDDPTAFAPPPAFGPFRVLHQIGIGALGPVYRTYEASRDRLIAVKVFRLDITPEQAQALADELARAADASLFHPSIVEPIAAGVEGTVAYRAEEYVAGESMDVAIRHYAPATLDKALPIITQLAGAIDFARAAGFGHGALHLRDIFVTPDEARASGFGVVDALERLGIRAPVRRPYTAPERIAGEPWGTPADVFSLAAISFELLTGRRPSGTGDQIGSLAAETAGPHAAGLRAVLARAMDDDPERRYQTALGFASALEAAARGEHVTAAVRDVGAIAAAAPAAAPPPEPEAIVAAPVPTSIVTTENEEPREHAEDLPGEEDASPIVFPRASDEIQSPAAAVPVHFDADLRARHRHEVEPEVTEDDDETAHFDVLRDEETAAPVVLDEDEIDTPPLNRFDRAEERSQQRAPVAVEPARSFERRPAVYEEEPHVHDAPLAGVSAERSRLALLPLTLALTLGLLLGFAAGYVVGDRDQLDQAAVGSTSEPETSTATAQPSAPGGSAPGAAKEFSEEAVTPPPGGTATPPSQAPGVPGDEPASSAAASRAAAPARETPAPSGTPGTAAGSAAKPAAPAPRQGSIVVRSTPAGASVTVNGKWRGRTPLRVDPAEFGPYTIRVVQPGYETAREEFTLSDGERSRTLSFRLRRTPAAAPPPAERPAAARTVQPPSPERGATYSGAVYVDSRPRGATILIDGKRVGTTPARIPDIAIGSHVIRLELEAHRAWTTSTRVSAGQETRVTGSLDPIR